jgi:hypothetical protein
MVKARRYLIRRLNSELAGILVKCASYVHDGRWRCILGFQVLSGTLVALKAAIGTPDGGREPQRPDPSPRAVPT